MKCLLCNKKDASTIPFPGTDKPDFIKYFCGFFKWSLGKVISSFNVISCSFSIFGVILLLKMGHVFVKYFI